MFSLLHFLTLLFKGKVWSLLGGPFTLMVGPGSGDGFQSFVNNALPPGIAGDFAGANIRANIVAGSFGYTATPAGVLVGDGGWANDATKQVSNYFQLGSVPGFVHREGQAVITNFLGVSTLTILGGMEVTLMAQGDFWGIFTAGATPGQKVYFDPLYGALSGNATGNSVTGANTASSITSGVLTTTDADQSGGALAVGQIITGSGIPAGTYIASSAGTGSGTHLWNLANLDGTAIANVTSEATANYGVQESQFFVASKVTVDCAFTASLAVPVAPSDFSILTVTAVGSGLLQPGQWLSATGLAASLNVQVLEQLTVTSGVGGTGTYLVSAGPLIGSTNSFVATQGKVGRISSWL